MDSERFDWRAVVLLTIPCVFLLLILNFIAHRSPSAPSSPPPAIRVTPTPARFWIEVKRFRLEPVNAENKKLGADTCVTVQTITHNALPAMNWFSCPRLIATKNGKTSVLWYDTIPWSHHNPWVGTTEENGGPNSGTQYHADHFLFKLRNVPPGRGELIFIWDTLAQPAGGTTVYRREKEVSLATLNRMAKAGGIRLSQRLLVRSDVSAVAGN